MKTSDQSPTPCDHNHADGSCCGHDHSHGHDHPHDHTHTSDNQQNFFFSLEALAIAIWGGVLVWYVSTGKVTPFLSTTGIFREQALVGGFALLVLAAFNFLLRKRFPGCGHDHSEEGGEEHHHHHDEGGWLSRIITIFILVAPVSIAAAYAPPDWTEKYKLTQANSLQAANAPTAGNAASAALKQGDGNANSPQGFTLEDFKKYCPPNDEGNFPLSVSNLWSAAGDPDLRRVLTGQTAEVTAQVVSDNFSTNGKRLRVFELQMTCCAADARPVSFAIEFPEKTPDYRESGWYQVTGTIDFAEERSGRVTVLKVSEMKPTTKPRQNGGQAL